MEVVPLEVYAQEANHAIVRPSGRRYPGAVIQGDSLAVLCSEARKISLALKELGVVDEELLLLVQEHQEKLLDRLLHYQQVLVAHGVELPYRIPVKKTDFVELVPPANG
jgi:hypothetical protein